MTELIDPYGRRIDYVRLSLTDKCNMRCFYCLPRDFRNFKQPDSWLTHHELIRIINAFSELGVSRFRLTGGEPLIRNDVFSLISKISSLAGVEDLSLSTNASLLGEHAFALKQAGLNRINVSLDSLQSERFKRITGGKLEKILNGLQAAKAAGIQPVKINMLVMKGIKRLLGVNCSQFWMDWRQQNGLG